MTRVNGGIGGTEGTKLVGGGIAFLLATLCVILLAMNGVGSELGRMALGLASVVMFAGGALSIGTSEQAQV